MARGRRSCRRGRRAPAPPRSAGPTARPARRTPRWRWRPAPRTTTTRTPNLYPGPTRRRAPRSKKHRPQARAGARPARRDRPKKLPSRRVCWRGARCAEEARRRTTSRPGAAIPFRWRRRARRCAKQTARRWGRHLRAPAASEPRRRPSARGARRHHQERTNQYHSLRARRSRRLCCGNLAWASGRGRIPQACATSYALFQTCRGGRGRTQRLPCAPVACGP
mmetsp:Transcript_14035/g.41302  ORF Transcript_14035/g.41302 Transcript_14035/m.41302 type:complete len:222 (-) Transcript_14035:127-792(-)